MVIESGLLEQALHLADNGLSVIPIRCDGNRAPSVLWKRFQSTRATRAELESWFGNGIKQGIGIVTGKISGNLEVLDFDDPELFEPWKELVTEQVGADLVERLVLINTPSGRFHASYRCKEAVEGNLKLAKRLNDEGKVITLIETRGEGGYALTVGSPPECHPNNKPYTLLQGDFANIPTITGAEREVLLNSARSLNEYVKPERIICAPFTPAGDRPGDHFNAEATWEEILEPHEWEKVRECNGKVFWKRPGKETEKGWSATTNHADTDLLYVFSSNAHPFESETAYPKFAAYTLLNHDGDFSAAAGELASQGYGSHLSSDLPERPETKVLNGDDPVSLTSEAHSNGDFFNRNTEARVEIIEGIIREGQLGILAGSFSVGKSPLLIDLTVHVLNGIPFCGRPVLKRPVIAFDFENSGPTYKQNIKNICSRYGVSIPSVPQELTVYLEHDAAEEEATKQLLKVLANRQIDPKIEFLKKALGEKPNALVIIDPLELLFSGIDMIKKVHILAVYAKLRLLLAKYKEAAILTTFNLRKKDRKATNAPDLLKDPRSWLEEVCGGLDIINRSDVRIGMDFHEEDIKVINGIRRGEEMHPLLVHSVGEPDQLAGFDRCPAEDVDFKEALTPVQNKHWNALPEVFRFEEMADTVVPRSSLHRLIKKTQSLGALSHESGEYRKVVKL